MTSRITAWRKRLREGAVKLYGTGWGLVIFLMTSEALASAGGKPATKLINVADTRALGSGFTKLVADIYNGNYWLYGLLVVVVMALMGLVLGLGFDRLIGLLGIDLGKLDHHE